MSDVYRESIQVFHNDDQSVLERALVLTCNYSREGCQWVGICDELGTSTFADTLEQTRIELQEAIQLQLNEVERIADLKGYLADNQVPLLPVQ